MKDKYFTEFFLSNDDIVSLKAISAATQATFSELVFCAGLDKKRDLCQSNLRGLELSNSDLRGFNFTGADLTGSIGINVIWDETTIFHNATVADSIFSSKVHLDDFFANNSKAYEVFDRVSREDWSAQILWYGRNLLKSGKYHDIATQVTEALFHRAKDDFLKAELLSYLGPRLSSPSQIKEILMSLLQKG